MTDEVVMVTCSITDEQVEQKDSVEYTLATGEVRYVSSNAVLSLVSQSLLPKVLNDIALNDAMYTEVVSIRKQAQANQAGIQQGANQAVQAIRQAAEELGVDVDSVLQKAFAPEATEEVEEVVEDEVATATQH